MRITDEVLNLFVDSINKKKNQPITTWTKREGVYKANIGNYHLKYNVDEYVELCQVINEGGGITIICSSCTNKELYYFMRGFLEGCDK